MGAVRNATGINLNPIKTAQSEINALNKGWKSISGQSAAERAANRGATAQQAAATSAIEEQRLAREQISQQLAPYMQAGEGVLGRLTGMAGQEIQGLPSVLPGDIGQDSLFNALKRQAISGIESSAAARGKLFSGTTPQAIAEQIQNLALSRAGDIQQQNLAARTQMLGEQQQRYGQLFNIAQLGQASGAQQAANIQGAAANIGNLLGQGANAYAASQIAQANAKAQAMSGLMQLGGTLGAAALMAPVASDRRVKEDIKQVGQMENGLPVYTFRYIGDNTVHMGVMAQDVEAVNPDAVVEINGIKHVNYGAL